jgi:hypothetical protein
MQLAKDDLIVSEDELGARLQAWLGADADRCVLSVERLSDGRLMLRHMPDVDPLLLAHVRVTLSKYREALMNLT